MELGSHMVVVEEDGPAGEEEAEVEPEAMVAHFFLPSVLAQSCCRASSGLWPCAEDGGMTRGGLWRMLFGDDKDFLVTDGDAV